jgi:hypothetical protein
MKRHISALEFKKVRSSLFSQDFTHDQINFVEALFTADLAESLRSERGIDEAEIEAQITWLKENPSKHKLSKEKVDILEAVLTEHLNA